jgi:RNA polymerase sigma factor (TIGR02999 family)
VIHEVYLKLAAGSQTAWEDRTHFFAVAAKAMRQVLVDHARAKHAAKRGGNVDALRLDDALTVADNSGDELIALDEALTALARLSPRQSEVVELRYFAGLSVEESAAMLKVSCETVMRDWSLAKAFLYREMKAQRPRPKPTPKP